MGKPSAFKEQAPWLFRQLKNNRQRSVGGGLIVLGILLAVGSRAAGGSPFQDFTAGILMGLSAGVLLVGIFVTLFSFRPKKDKDF